MFCLLLQYVVLTLSFLTFMLLSIDQKRRGPNVIHQTIMVLIRMSKPYNRWFGIGYFVGSILNVFKPPAKPVSVGHHHKNVDFFWL